MLIPEEEGCEILDPTELFFYLFYICLSFVAPARAQRPGWEARWGSEEPARMSSATATSGSVAPVQTAAVIPADAHPAYTARVERPGWEARWGDEEKDRVAGAPAGAVAVAGAAAGFATAGGLDTPAAGSASAVGSSGSVGGSAGDPLVDDLLPENVGELRDMVRQTGSRDFWRVCLPDDVKVAVVRFRLFDKFYECQRSSPNL